MSTFQVLVLIGVYGGIFFMGLGFQGIYRRLGDILDEMTGETEKTLREADFYDRGDRPSKGKEPR